MRVAYRKRAAFGHYGFDASTEDHELFADVRSLFTAFYHVTPTQAQLRQLVAEQ